MFARGRPKDQAPEGHVTVREAAERLGVTQAAIRQRVKRGTLRTLITTTSTRGKELRYYIPIEALEEALKPDREPQPPMEEQRVGVDALAARLDAMSERQERTERKLAELVDNLERQDRIGVAQEESALRERLETAERERDELLMQISRLVDPQEEPSQEVADEPTEGFESSERIGAEAPSFGGIDGNKVKQLRKGRFWTQEDLSKKSGVNRMTISEIERGLNTHPRWGTIRRLARAFGVPPEKLIFPAP